VTRADDYSDVIRFHGHECPGAALGVRIAEIAVARYGRHTPDNEIVALAETDACGVDAVQVLTGCTYGKRNLRHEDNGKTAFTFWRRGEDTGVRVLARFGTDAYRDETTWALADKIADGTATGADRDTFASLQAARIQRILAAPADELLSVETVAVEPPAPKAVAPSEPCEKCGEPTSVEILHNHRGAMLCAGCHLDAHGGALPADHGPGHAHDHSHPRAHHHHGHESGHAHAHQH
jgi:formylmethanofuran dehydrogenase subunit E